MIDQALLKEIIRNNIQDEEIQKVEITNDTSLLEDLMLDSITFIQLIVELEENFNIEINDVDFEKIDKFSDLYQCLCDLINEYS